MNNLTFFRRISISTSRNFVGSRQTEELMSRLKAAPGDQLDQSYGRRSQCMAADGEILLPTRQKYQLRRGCRVGAIAEVDIHRVDAVCQDCTAASLSCRRVFGVVGIIDEVGNILPDPARLLAKHLALWSWSYLFRFERTRISWIPESTSQAITVYIEASVRSRAT
jgi:hypothetical protein